MHELGIMFSIVRTVEGIARENNLSKIDTLVLQIGELSPVVPKFIKACYPAAVDGTMLEETKLKIEITPGNAICKSCGKVYNFLDSAKTCPNCSSISFDILSGKEFNIKEIIAN